MSTDAEDKTEMDTQGTDVSTSLARARESGEAFLLVVVQQGVLIHGTDTQLTLDGSNDWGTLEQGTLHVLESLLDLCLAAWLSVEANNGNVFLTSGLLGLHQASGAINADKQATRNLGIEGTGVTGLFTLHDFLHPRPANMFQIYNEEKSK
jgi:hypothetical protein